MTATDLACALLVPALWGLQYVVTKIGLAAFPPFFFVGLRFAAIALLLAPVTRMPTRREIGPVVLISIFLGGLNFGLSFAGLEHGQAGASSVVNQLSSPIMILLAWPILGERPSLRVMGGVILAFGGVVLMVLEPGAAISVVPTVMMAGAAWRLLPAACWPSETVRSSNACTDATAVPSETPCRRAVVATISCRFSRARIARPVAPVYRSPMSVRSRDATHV